MPVVLAKHMPIAQQLAPGAEPQAVSHSLSVAHAVLAQAEPPLSSPLPLLEPEFWLLSPLPLLPEELLPLLLPLLLFTEASAPPFLGVKPEVVLFEPPQAAIKPTAPRPIVRLRIEPIFIWPSLCRTDVRRPTSLILVDGLSWFGQRVTAQSSLILS